jgi:heme exporter protein C
MDMSMLYPLLIMIIAFFLFYITILMLRLRVTLVKRDIKSQWVEQVIAGHE